MEIVFEMTIKVEFFLYSNHMVIIVMMLTFDCLEPFATVKKVSSAETENATAHPKAECFGMELNVGCVTMVTHVPQLAIVKLEHITQRHLLLYVHKGFACAQQGTLLSTLELPHFHLLHLLVAVIASVSFIFRV